MKDLSEYSTPRNLTLSLALDPDCVVTFTPPSLYSSLARQCYSRPDAISSCNATGKWKKRDSFLERACLSYQTPKVVDGKLYRNVFCFLCNHANNDAGVQIALTACQRHPGSLPGPLGGTHNKEDGLPLALTLNSFDITQELKREVLFEGPSDRSCRQTEVWDFKQKKCREVFCAVGQKLILGLCEPMFLSLTGVAFELYFKLQPDQPIDLSGEYDLLHHLPTELEHHLDDNILHGTVNILDFAMAFNTTGTNGDCTQQAHTLAVYAKVLNVSAIDQATLQEELLRIRNAQLRVNIRGWTMSFQAIPDESIWHMMQPSRRQSPHTLSACVIIVSNIHLEQNKEGLRRVGTTTPNPATVNSQPMTAVRISGLLRCPQVSLTADEYTKTPGSDEIHLLWEGGGNITADKYVMAEDESVSICLDEFLTRLGFDRSKRSSAEKVVVSVLLPISIMCLIATLSVFLAFSALRTPPGKANILLVACLLCSQAALFLVYLENDVRTIGCAVKGAIAHYLCLAVVVAQTACSHHVYAAFTTMHLQAMLKREGRYLTVYSVITFTVPLLIVSAVILINMLQTETVLQHPDSLSLSDTTAASYSMSRSSRRFGYGGGALCLLSTPLATWVALLLPLVIGVAALIVLFALTYSSLRSIARDIETSSHVVRHVHFYFRLGLLICLSWILALLGHVTAQPALRIAFVVLYCLCGCYTFFALVLTRQVTRLITGCCCGSRRPPLGRTSLNLKMLPPTECHNPQNPCIVATGFRPTAAVADIDLEDGVYPERHEIGNTARAQQMPEQWEGSWKRFPVYCAGERASPKNVGRVPWSPNFKGGQEFSYEQGRSPVIGYGSKVVPGITRGGNVEDRRKFQNISGSPCMGTWRKRDPDANYDNAPKGIEVNIEQQPGNSMSPEMGRRVVDTNKKQVDTGEANVGIRSRQSKSGQSGEYESYCFNKGADQRNAPNHSQHQHHQHNVRFAESTQ